MSEHAKFSPSAAKRWKKCPASVKEAQNVPNTDTEASTQGTAMHWAYAEWLTKGSPPDVGVRAPNGVVLTVEMMELVGEAVGWVLAYLKEHPGSSIAVEEKVQIGSPYFGLDEDLLWGTCDTRIMAKHELVVVDLKTGWTDVQAEENEQLTLYTVGLAEELGWLWDNYRFVIIQPKNGGVKEWEVSRVELQRLADEFKEPIANALSEAPRYEPSEEGCRFCPAAAVCQRLHEEAIVLAKREFEDPQALVKHITVEQMVQLLDKADLIRGVLSAVEEHALSLIQIGKEIPGYKAVAGRKNRIWKPGAEEKLSKLLGEKAYAKPKLISPAQAEKLIAKGVFDDLSEKPAGEPQLAPVTDKRPALAPHFEAVDMGDVLA